MTLAALEATLRLYLDEQLARKRIPTVAMITAAPDELKRQGLATGFPPRQGVRGQGRNPAGAGRTRVGGGSFPENALPTTLVRAVPTGCTPECLKQRLLETVPPLSDALRSCLPARSAHACRRGTALAANVTRLQLNQA